VAIDHSSLWAAELARRVRKGFIRTVISTSALTALFFVAYFWVQRHPAFVPMVMPRTQLDLMIPFQPVAILAYLSVWVYIGVGPGLHGQPQRPLQAQDAVGAALHSFLVGHYQAIGQRILEHGGIGVAPPVFVDEERHRLGEILHDYAHMVHPLDCHGLNGRSS